MANLYELTNSWIQVNRLFDDEEIDIDVLTDTLESIEEPIKEKIENIGKLIAKYQSDSEALKAEAKRLTERASRATKQIEMLKEYISENLKRANIERVEGKLFTFSFRKSTAVNVTDPDMVPDLFKKTKVEVTIDKKLLAEALKNGESITGAELQENKNLQIK